MTKKHYTVGGMHCSSCAMVIEGELEDVGVRARCSYAKATLEVEFDETKTEEKMIHDVVVKAGYSVVSSKP
jgi:copper chaperone CopZ